MNADTPLSTSRVNAVRNEPPAGLLGLAGGFFVDRVIRAAILCFRRCWQLAERWLRASDRIVVRVSELVIQAHKKTPMKSLLESLHRGLGVVV